MASSVENTTHSYQHQQGGHGGTAHSGSCDPYNTFSRFMEHFRHRGDFTQISKIDGGEGDDTINSTTYRADISGGAGNDIINASGGVLNVDGGAGDDSINATSIPVISAFSLHGCCGFYAHFHPVCHMSLLQIAEVNGGAGNDTIEGRGLLKINGGEGDDVIQGHGGLVSVFGGSGNDTIYTGGGSTTVNGGAGDDYINNGTSPININGYIQGGAGDDVMDISGKTMRVFGGTGNDTLNLDHLGGVDTVGAGALHTPFGQSIVGGGIGDDTLNFNGGWAQIDYHVGDGHDVIAGADEQSTLKLGAGLTFEGTGFSIEGNDLILNFADSEGSVTFKNYNTQGLPTIEYADGRILDASSTIAYAGGDPDAYVGSDNPAQASGEGGNGDDAGDDGDDTSTTDHATDHDD